MLDLFAFAWINLLGVMSPGPDFAIVTRYGFSGSRRAAFFVTLGITAALFIHVFYCMFGIAVFLQNSPLIFRAFQAVGACYLGYMGFKLLRTPLTAAPLEKSTTLVRGAFAAGFLTNLLNPKCTLFTLSLFSQFLQPDTSAFKKALFAFLMPATAFLWFGALSYLLTHPTFLPRIQRFQGHFTRAMGGFLVLLSIGILATLLT